MDLLDDRVWPRIVLSAATVSMSLLSVVVKNAWYRSVPTSVGYSTSFGFRPGILRATSLPTVFSRDRNAMNSTFAPHSGSSELSVG